MSDADDDEPQILGVNIGSITPMNTWWTDSNHRVFKQK